MLVLFCFFSFVFLQKKTRLTKQTKTSICKRVKNTGVKNGPWVGRSGHNLLLQEIIKVREGDLHDVEEGARRLRKTFSLPEICRRCIVSSPFSNSSTVQQQTVNKTFLNAN